MIHSWPVTTSDLPRNGAACGQHGAVQIAFQGARGTSPCPAEPSAFCLASFVDYFFSFFFFLPFLPGSLLFSSLDAWVRTDQTTYLHHDKSVSHKRRNDSILKITPKPSCNCCAGWDVFLHSPGTVGGRLRKRPGESRSFS